MLSTQKLLSSLNEMKTISGMDFFLFQADGLFVVATEENRSLFNDCLSEFVHSEEMQLKQKDAYLFKLEVEGKIQYILVGYGKVENAFVIAEMASCQIRNLLLSKSEQFNRNNFIQNVLLGNMLSVDIYSKAKKLHIEPRERVVYVIDTNGKSTDLVMEFVKNLSDLKARDFVTCVDEHSIVLVKEVSSIVEETKEKELEEIAKSLVDNLHMEAMTKVRVGYGNVVEQISEITRSFQEAKLALQVGKVFYAEHDTISYGKLGIGRLIYQLPMNLCEMFIKEVFGEKIPDIFEDEEEISIINKFFENNLNISETARQLYIHRNTLVYRLDRFEKIIGLDIRKFDDAMTYRIATMVMAHMKNQKK